LTVLACTDAQRSTWGLDAITKMTTPPDPDAGCGVVLPPESYTFRREHCDFGTGDRPAATLGMPPEVGSAIPIRHVLVVMRENRSFDHLYGELSDAPAGYTNPHVDGGTVARFNSTTTCIPTDPPHQSGAMDRRARRPDGRVRHQRR